MNPWVIIGFMAAVIAVGAIGYNKGHEIGRNTCLQEWQDAAIKAQREKEAQVAKEKTIARESVEKEQTIKEVIRYVERKVPVVVTPKCADLGPDWLGLHNEAARAANGEPD